jgi:threonine/homoserine/homoserine lactone efflux protein
VPNVLAFASYVVLTTFTPGPNNIMSMSNASRFGLRGSTRFRLGETVGFFLVIAATFIFTVVMYRAIPTIKPYMTVVGAAYILWLAYKTVTSSPHDDGAAGQNTLLSGVLLQFLNPKVILFGVTVSATFIVPYYTSPAILVGFAVGLALVCLAAVTSWAVFGSVFQRFMANNHRIVSWVMGGLLVYCAVALFL